MAGWGEGVFSGDKKDGSKCTEVLVHLLGAGRTSSPNSAMACQRARGNQEIAENSLPVRLGSFRGPDDLWTSPSAGLEGDKSFRKERKGIGE